MTDADFVFHKYLKIRIIGDRDNVDLKKEEDQEVVIQEKIDGANFRFTVMKDGSIMFGSRNQQLGDSSKNFNACMEFIRYTLWGKNLTEHVGRIFYGECCVRHSLVYDWVNMPKFLGFDVMDTDGTYRADAKEIFESLGLPTVPEIWRGPVSEMPVINEAYIPKSAWAESQAEGVVCKNYETQVFAKYVTDKFKEVNKKAFGGKGPNTNPGDTDKIVNKYCTNPRIDKQIFAMVNEGMNLEMALMSELPRRVWADIVEECGADLLTSRLVIDVSAIRKEVGKRCVEVLKQMITNHQINGDVEPWHAT